MEMPAGLSEEQVLTTIDIVATRLAYKFKFGYNDVNDMKQEARLFALKVLHKWDGKRPLENFLYRCVHNLLYNNKRDNYGRPIKPCLTCPLYDEACNKSTNQCEGFEDKNDCKMYAAWIARNEAKKNIMSPIDIGSVQDDGEDNMRLNDHTEKVEQQEIWDIIDKHLDVKYRADYIKLRNNIKLPKPRRVAVEEAILEITRQYYEPR